MTPGSAVRQATNYATGPFIRLFSPDKLIWIQIVRYYCNAFSTILTSNTRSVCVWGGGGAHWEGLVHYCVQATFE